MSSTAPVLVTGISGNLGRRLLPQLADTRVIGLDFRPPQAEFPNFEFHPLDLARESSCQQLVDLMREVRPRAVIHLAFVIDPVQTGITALDAMWQVNVAGTARVVEAIAEHNRLGGDVRALIALSSVSAYGPDLPPLVSEDHPLAAHTLPYAVHKKEVDRLLQQRAESMWNCSTFILRPPIFIGPSVENYLVGAIRGTAGGKSKTAARLRERGTRLPMLLPSGHKYLENRFQFIHVDDMARIIAAILRDDRKHPPCTVMNVASAGDTLSLADCAQRAHAKVLSLPGKWACRAVLRLLWSAGISSVPPEALPYFTGSYTMNTERLKSFLGPRYSEVVRYSIADAFDETFSSAAAAHHA
jgi:nucleoside-diphosphate-sugar epimerase